MTILTLTESDYEAAGDDPYCLNLPLPTGHYRLIRVNPYTEAVDMTRYVSYWDAKAALARLHPGDYAIYKMGPNGSMSATIEEDE